MLSDQLRQMIADSGKSVNAIARESGIPQPMLARFTAGWDMRLATAEKLAAYFGLELAPKKKPRAKKPAK